VSVLSSCVAAGTVLDLDLDLVFSVAVAGSRDEEAILVDDVTVSVLSSCGAAGTVLDLDLAVVSGAVAGTPGCHSPGTRLDVVVGGTRLLVVVGGPLSLNTYVCSPAVSASTSSTTMTLSRLEPRDRRRPAAGACDVESLDVVTQLSAAGACEVESLDVLTQSSGSR